MHSFVEGGGGAGPGPREGEGYGQGNPRQLIFIIHSQQKYFLGTYTKFLKTAISFIMSVCPSFPKEQLGSHWNVFHEI
jgi:hypothetical protein